MDGICDDDSDASNGAIQTDINRWAIAMKSIRWCIFKLHQIMPARDTRKLNFEFEIRISNSSTQEKIIARIKYNSFEIGILESCKAP